MANESYINKGTAKVANTDFTWTVCGASAITNGTGRISQQINWGAAPRPEEYTWSCEIVLAAAGTQYATLDLYVAGAPDDDSTQIDADVGASDAALTADQRYNLRYIGSLVNEDGSGTNKIVASGRFRFTERYMSLGIWNGSGATTSATAGDFVFTIQPVYNVPGT